jgi:hypothetical protein
MSSIVLSGDTSGTVTVSVPAVAGTNTVTIPAVTGTAVVSGQNSAITAATAQASTSGTSIDFTSIPSWVKRITVMFSGVTVNAISSIIVQIGAGSVVTTGYVGTAGGVGNTGNVWTVISYTTGFGVAGSMSSADQTYNGNLSICLLNSATGLWAANGSTSLSPGTYTGLQVCGGSKTLSGTLDRVRITTVGGSATFTAGSINILYE